MGEVGNDMTDKGLISNMYKRLIQLNIKKTTLKKKMWWKKYFQTGHADGQQTHERLLNIANLQRDANQDHITLRMAIIKNINNKSWQRYGEKRALLHCWWECKLVQPLWKTV